MTMLGVRLDEETTRCLDIITKKMDRSRSDATRRAIKIVAGMVTEDFGNNLIKKSRINTSRKALQS